MSLLKINDYCSIPFTAEICKDDFYTYSNIADLLSKCEKDREKVIKIRTIGILESINGRFFIKDVESAKIDAPKLLVSMAYVKTSLHSSIIPYTVQLFGTLQWLSQPVVQAQLVQILKPSAALRLNDVMQEICHKHSAKSDQVLQYL
ncbi:uncharacterized protein LOC124535530 [Vanessa cardui]|uniref:uncharacterized protein LOC124535530 n=1 Tax=Vanessa cardui TaxID=171605 RepID=UPI001F13E7C6|nr:uncharacterized protein LOC124535530 [Vanessa cardui]